MNGCKFNKAKRQVVTNLASFLPADATDEQKGAICELISAAFERNKAKTALGI
jgi:hypothetical protein